MKNEITFPRERRIAQIGVATDLRQKQVVIKGLRCIDENGVKFINKIWDESGT